MDEPHGIINSAHVQQFIFSMKCEKHCRTVADVSATQWPLPIQHFPVLLFIVCSMMCLDALAQTVWIIHVFSGMWGGVGEH